MKKVSVTRKKFEVEIFKTVLNNALSTLDKRYFKNKNLIYDASFFDPRNFFNWKNGFYFYRRIYLKFANLARVDVVELQSEWIKFAQDYDILSESVLLGYTRV